jgi:hypothetical protein
VAGTIEKNIRMLLDGQLTVLNDASCGAHSDHDHTHE